ncbi:23S rRNA (uracil(1939)-C(5))-methyltransferase RlmD [uncultured Phascolarctobacterium sp.]|uniref:23S rRNA (uracil(1939)-C(5))-methyltransferase RlmD n=1 Tax=uncultured Phascolarctobacterium sp. TaxID=512296 RepID=UPI002612A5B9|nr:23S rRNA (uracil(1939)-C(5))-methyltransferase RlmD [uncultured Phascolarctobacterium sp.]
MKMQIPVKLGDKIELQISGLGSSGEGVGKYEGFTVFVKGALPEETVQVKITLVKKSYAVGLLEQIVTASSERVEPLCPIYAECGGCQLQHLSYKGQLACKRQQVQDALARIGHLDIEALPVLGTSEPWNYRNKMQFPAALNAEGELQIGCYAAATHKVINADGCLISKEANNAILTTVRKWMQHFNISAYDEKTGKGMVRHVMGRVGVHSGEVMAVIITSGYDLPHRATLVNWLKQYVPGLVSVVQNINKKQTNVVMGSKTRVLWGCESIKDSLGSLQFNISAQAFFQVNSEQAEKLYNKALEFAALDGSETVVDVYCGTGTISLYLARHAKKVYGIEIVAPAIENAKKNAEENKCSNAEFILGDAAVELPKLLAGGVNPDVVLVDPPRAGCEEKVLAAISSVAPKRIVYVSCNPASLARDLRYLEDHGYKTVIVQPVDMFPMTSHVECVVLLTRAGEQKAHVFN